MDHYRIVAVFIVFFLPYLFKKLLGADDLSPVFAEDPEDIELDGCQCQLSFIIDAFMRIAVQEKTAEINDVFLRTVSFVVFGRPPQLGFDTVSYTHLDVYKRQTVWIPDWRSHRQDAAAG